MTLLQGDPRVLNYLRAGMRSQRQTSHCICWRGGMLEELPASPWELSGPQVSELSSQHPGDNACDFQVKWCSNHSVGCNEIIWKCWVSLWQVFPNTDPQSHEVDKMDPCTALAPHPSCTPTARPRNRGPCRLWPNAWIVQVGDTGGDMELTVDHPCSSVFRLWIRPHNHTTGASQARTLSHFVTRAADVESGWWPSLVKAE